MANLKKQKQVLQQKEKEMKAYKSKNLPSLVEQQVQKQWTPVLKRATGETQRMMSEFLPRYMNIPYEGMAGGTTAESLTPQQKMSLMGGELGSLVGKLTAQSNLSSYLGGRAADMQNKAIQAMQLGQQAAADSYSRAFQRYQLAYQAAEAEKQRQWEAEQARLNREAAARARASSGLAPINYPQVPQVTLSPEQQRDQDYVSRLTGYASSGDFDALANTLERWGGEISPKGWESMSPEWQNYLSQWWQVAHEGRYGDPNAAKSYVSSQIQQPMNQLPY